MTGNVDAGLVVGIEDLWQRCKSLAVSGAMVAGLGTLDSETWYENLQS